MALQNPSDSLSTVPREALAAIAERAAEFPELLRSRGAQYLRAGRVGPLQAEPHAIRAVVRGTRRYRSSWEWKEGEALPRCTCPAGPECKHAFALAASILLAARHRMTSLPASIRRLLPREPIAAAGRVAESRASAPARRYDRQLETLRATRDPWRRRQVLADLLRGGPLNGMSVSQEGFEEIIAEPDPDLLCWQLAQAISQVANGWLPKGLEAFRDRPDLFERVRQREYEQMATGLIDWAEHRTAGPQRSLRVIFGLAENDAVPAVTLEARVTTPRYRDEPRRLHRLLQLRTELRRDPRLLAPPQARLLQTLTEGATAAALSATPDRLGLSATTLHFLLDRLSNSPLATWSDRIPEALRARAGVRPGDRVRLADDTILLLPMCVREGENWWVTLAAVWPDGRRRVMDEVILVPSSDEHHPSLVLADGAFWAAGEEPPPALLQRFELAGALPVPREGRRAFLERLMASFPTVREALAPHTRVHDATPVVALELDVDDWLEIRLFAHAGGEEWRPGEPPREGEIVFELSAHKGWLRAEEAVARAEAAAEGGYRMMPEAAPTQEQRLATNAAARPAGGSGPCPESGEILLEIPDETRVAEAHDWIVSLPVAVSRRSARGRGAAADGRGTGTGGSDPAAACGWWMRLTAANVEALAEAWERRPAGVRWFGNRRVSDLLAGGRRVMPRLRIVASGTDWLSVSAEWEAEGLALTEADLARLRDARTRFVRLSGAWVRRELVREHDETAELLADLGVEAGSGEQRLALAQLAQARPETLRSLERIGGPEIVDHLAELRRSIAAFEGLPHVPVPAGIRAELRPYQRLGLDFVAYASSLGLGAVLADDMGLGKTVQALAWLEHLRERDPDGGPALVVCPASVVHNWAREAERFAPDLRVLLLTSGRRRHALRGAVPEHDLIVTNYALFRRDIAAWKDVPLRAVILDEAQNVKNPDAAVTRAALQLTPPLRLALTGTPLENRALDLWSIMSFVNPGYLGNRAAFVDRYDRPDAPPHARRLLAARLRPVLLRRLKQEVAQDLPERIEEVLDCQLTAGQRQLYLAELTQARRQVDHLAAERGGVRQHKIEILAALTRLRQICCHPALAGGQLDVGSGKFDALFELLEPLLAEGHKALLFSQFVECLKLLERELKRRRIAYHVLTGSTVRREEVVRAFSEDREPGVFLISLRAGGTGLNLTAASYVVLFDPWWNPAVEAQAIDRTHRIGQKRTVIAYRMLAEGTIEERIWRLQQRKAALARDVLGENGFARALTREDLRYLLAEE